MFLLLLFVALSVAQTTTSYRISGGFADAACTLPIFYGISKTSTNCQPSSCIGPLAGTYQSTTCSSTLPRVDGFTVVRSENANCPASDASTLAYYNNRGACIPGFGTSVTASCTSTSATLTRHTTADCSDVGTPEQHPVGQCNRSSVLGGPMQFNLLSCGNIGAPSSTGTTMVATYGGIICALVLLLLT